MLVDPHGQILHFFGEIGAVFGLDGGQTILVDQHRLMRQPHLPSFATDIVEDALAKFAWIRRLAKLFAFAPEFDALNCRHAADLTSIRQPWAD